MRNLMLLIVAGILTWPLQASPSTLTGTWELEEEFCTEDLGCSSAFGRLVFEDDGTCRVEMSITFGTDFWIDLFGEEVKEFDLPTWESFSLKAIGTYEDDGSMFQMTFDMYEQYIDDEDAILFFEEAVRHLAIMIADAQGLTGEEREAAIEAAVQEVMSSEEPLIEGLDLPTAYEVDGNSLTIFDPETGEPMTFQRVQNTAVATATWGAIKVEGR